MRKTLISLSLLIILFTGCDETYKTAPKFARGDIVLIKNSDETYSKGIIDSTFTWKQEHSYSILVRNHDKNLTVKEKDLVLYKTMDWTVEAKK